MTMRLIFGYGAFFLYFLTITADYGSGGFPAECSWNTTYIDKTYDKYLEAGVHKIYDSLLAKVKSNDTHFAITKYTVDLPDLQICKQIEGETTLKYIFFWKKEDYTVQCLYPEFCGDYHREYSKNVNCNATYWVNEMGNFAQFFGPNCD